MSLSSEGSVKQCLVETSLTQTDCNNTISSSLITLLTTE